MPRNGYQLIVGTRNVLDARRNCSHSSCTNSEFLYYHVIVHSQASSAVSLNWNARYWGSCTLLQTFVERMLRGWGLITGICFAVPQYSKRQPIRPLNAILSISPPQSRLDQQGHQNYNYVFCTVPCILPFTFQSGFWAGGTCVHSNMAFTATISN